MKRLFCVFLSCLCLITVLLFSASSECELRPIRLAFKSDIAGVSVTDTEKYCEILSDNIVLSDSLPIVADYAGDLFSDTFKAGRTYSIQYTFRMADGCTFPEPIDSTTVQYTCAKGCQVYACQKAVDASSSCLLVYSSVTVQGNCVQMLFGRIADFFLKLRAWSLY